MNHQSILTFRNPTTLLKIILPVFCLQFGLYYILICHLLYLEILKTLLYDPKHKIKLNVGSTDVGNFSDTWFLTEDGYTKYYLYHENYLNTIIHILYEQRKYK